MVFGHFFKLDSFGLTADELGDESKKQGFLNRN